MAADGDKSSNHYKALLRRQHEPCDFCDRTFKNRFESIIHNASHIIIPLLKQHWHQCALCLYYFPSQLHLDNHHKTKHPNILKHTQNVNNICITKIKVENTDEYDTIEINDDFDYKNSNRHLKLENIIKEENDDHRNDVYKHNSMEINNALIKVEKSDYSNGVYDEIEENFKDIAKGNAESFKSRLKFEEDDLFDNDILNGLITDCKVKMFNEPINEMPGFMNLNISNDSKGINNFKNNNGFNIRIAPIQTLISGVIKSNFNKPIPNANNNINKINESIVTDNYAYDNFIESKSKDKSRKIEDGFNNVHIEGKNVPIVPEPIYESVHYLDLTRPGIFSCKLCLKSFPDRLLLIQHEVLHIHIRRPRPLLCTFCDRYIAGNYITLRNHILAKHPGAPVDKKHKTHRCTRCSLKFRKYLTHVRNYHPYDCQGCGKEFNEDSKNEMELHEEVCASRSVLSKIVNVCELCYSFFKVTKKLKYVSLGSTDNEPGVRYPCSMCGKKFFELMRIKRVMVSGHCGSNLKGYTKYKKPLTNVERLKKFQHRLKQINLLNKFYTAVLFHPVILSPPNFSQPF